MKDEHKPASAHEMVSKRLVEYFLVYSCKPKRRNKDKDKDPNDKKNDGQQQQHNGRNDNHNHNHDRGHGGKGKGGTKTDSNRSFGKRMNDFKSFRVTTSLICTTIGYTSVGTF